MKKLRTRLVSAFLVIMTLLTLLPTSALAASGSGAGIKPTDNTNYWTTRLLHDGTPYSYKPPMAAGKLLYCLTRLRLPLGHCQLSEQLHLYLRHRSGRGYRAENGAGAERHG